MTVGAEPKKVAILAVLLLGAAYSFYVNVFSGDDGPPPQSPAQTPQAAAPRPLIPAPVTAPRQAPPISRDRRTSNQEWTPTLKPKRPEDYPDPMTVDPSLRVDLLGKLGAVEIAGGNRSLFEFSQAPPPKAPDPKILPKPVKPEAGKGTETAGIESAKVEPKEPAKAPPPPIPLKFYGFINGAGKRRAFFLNGEDIVVGSEGEVVEKFYKIIRISLTSAVVEDTRHSHQQTIRIIDLPQGT